MDIDANVTNIALNIASGLATTLLTLCWSRCRDLLPPERASLQQAYEHAFSAMVEAIAPDLAEGDRFDLDDTLQDFLRQDGVADRLLDIALTDTHPDLTLLQMPFETAFQAVGLPTDFNTAIVPFYDSFRREVEALAGQDDSNIFNRFVVKNVRAIQAQIADLDADQRRLLDVVEDVHREVMTVKDYLQQEPSRQAVPFVLPQQDVPTFTGRSAELTQLEDLLLRRSGAKVCSIVGLTGAGGVGKSALACHFAQQRRDDFPDGVIGLRVDGKDLDTIAREFAGEVIRLPPNEKRDARALMQHVFRHRRALLIFDNADQVDIASLRRLLPGGETCAVIITTRNRELPEALDIPSQAQLDVDVLPNAEARLLLERLVGVERVASDPPAIETIIQLVGGLPLALQIVGKALRSRAWEQAPLGAYAKTLRDERARLARLRIRQDSELDVAASFSLSLRLLQPEEADFFACLSVCGRDGFGIRAGMAVSQSDAVTVRERLGLLHSLSLLNDVPASNRFVFHPLLRLFARELAVERDLYDPTVARHAAYFVALVKTADMRDGMVVADLAQDLDELLLAADWLLQNGQFDSEFVIHLQRVFQQHGSWRVAAALMARFMDLAERQSDWLAVVQCRLQQAKYLSLQGDVSGAELVLVPVATLLDRILPADRPRLEAMWLTTLGGVWQRQGRFDEAIDAFQRSYELLVQLGDQRGQAMALNSLGGVLQRQSRFDDAIDAFQHSARIEDRLGNQRGQAMVLNSLGGVLQRQGRFDEAIDAFQHSARIEDRLGNQRGQAMVLNSLGGVLQRQGRFDAAIDAFQHSYELLVKLGDQRGQAMVLNSLGGVLQRQGRFDEAIDAFQHSARIEDRLGNQRGQAMVLNSLGGVLQRQGRFDEAIDAFQRSLAISERLDDQQSLAMALNSLGGVLQRQGRFDEAIAAFQRGLAILEPSDDERSLAMALNSLGGVLQRQGRFDEAIAAFQRGLAILEPSDDERSIAMVLNSLGGVLQRQGRFDEAIDAFQRSLAISERLDDQQSLAMALNSLGGVLQRQGRFEDAIVAFHRSHDLLVKLRDQRGQAMALNSLGGVLQRQGRFDEAMDAFQRSLTISEQLGDQRGQAMVLNGLGGVLQHQGHFDAASDAFRRSIAIGEQLGDTRHLAMVHTALGHAWLKQHDLDRARAAFQRGFEIDEGLKNGYGIGKAAPPLIETLVKLGRAEDALAICRRALAVTPNERRCLTWLDQLTTPPVLDHQGHIKRVLRHHEHGYLYGFIVPDDGGPDLYFKEDHVAPSSLPKLTVKARVGYTLVSRRDRSYATNVTVLC